jgi:hypothetical protein
MLGRPVGVSLAVVLLVGVVPAGIGAMPADGSVANEPPLVDAGLDQQVQYGATVRLDGTGSRDPDGEIVSYEWSIRRPNGTTVQPECPSCGRTSFRPASVGTYDVTLTATDDSGTTRSDTLYVEVEAGAGPSVSLSGPTSPRVGSERLYIASITAGGQPVDRITWLVGGREVNSTSATAGNTTGKFRFPSTDETSVGVIVTDEAGKRASENLSISPQSTPSVSVRSRPSGGNDRENPDGQYSPQLGIWIEGDGADGESEATAMAKGNYDYLGPRDIGGLNDDEPWDNGNGNVNADIIGNPENSDDGGAEGSSDQEEGVSGGNTGLENIGQTISESVGGIL